MSQFKPGDICVVVGGPDMSAEDADLVGKEVTLTEWFIFWGVRCWYTTDDNSRGYRESILRLKRPQDDAEPRADFTPCDDDFREWLKARQRERV